MAEPAERLVDIEVLFDGLGFASVDDPEGRGVLAVPKADHRPDLVALWRLLTDPDLVPLSETDLSSDDYLLIALERMTGRAAVAPGA